MNSYPNYENIYQTEISVGDKKVTVEVGRFSEQVAAAVMTKCGETMVLTTIGLGNKVDWGYLPLSVEFEEKLYANGIIKGSRWVKRMGRASDDAVLKARVIDRTIRPLFPDGLSHEIQIINTIFSYDEKNDPDMLALLGTTIGLEISQIPFDGPVAGIKVGYFKETGKFIFNPTHEELATSDLDLIVSGSGDRIVMVEAGANEIDETIMIEALKKAQTELGQITDKIAQIKTEIGKEKEDLVPAKDEAVESIKTDLLDGISQKYQSEIAQMVKKQGLLEPTGQAEFVKKLAEEFDNSQDETAAVIIDAKLLGGLVEKLMKAETRRMILEDSLRPDGRKSDEIRQIWVELDLFPRTHGSAMFKRGATQAVTITTLGDPSQAQHTEDMGGEAQRHYMHFYNMPPYSWGGTGRMGWPKRREVGHGALAQRALEPMIPSQEKFPYTVHVVSEILSSNGSTSQASVCGSTLSLMAAGVPITRPVSGIAMGMISEGEKYVVLSDIQGLEDHVGDMDFKVAGTSEGITAIQMDIKLSGLSMEVLTEALAKAKTGRMHIMEEMLKAIQEPRKELSPLAPKIHQITIPADKIGELIGPGGKVIKDIIAQSGAEVNVDEDETGKHGLVNISSSDQAAIDKAVEMVEGLMYEAKVGDEFDGQVVRIENYGAFVNYLPGKDGLVHVSEMSVDFVQDPNTIVKLGDTVHVRVAEIKDDGKISLTMLSEEERAQQRSNRSNKPPFKGRRNGGGDRGGRSSRPGGQNRQR